MLENTPPELRKRWENDRNVVPKFGQPEDMAAAVVFLATGGRGRYITGQTLVVDGGATIKASE
jgi:NAD(P)-dependent dehydrogenase (short-subunit alcohol dehydrogenase family)